MIIDYFTYILKQFYIDMIIETSKLTQLMYPLNFLFNDFSPLPKFYGFLVNLQKHKIHSHLPPLHHKLNQHSFHSQCIILRRIISPQRRQYSIHQLINNNLGFHSLVDVFAEVGLDALGYLGAVALGDGWD
jgi:hypothetical protein